MLLNNIPYLDELSLMDKVEYLYYADLVNYISERDKSHNTKRLLKKTRAYFELIRNKYNIIENFEEIRKELELYYTNNVLEDNNISIPGIKYSSTSNNKWECEPFSYETELDAIDLMSLI